MKRIILISILLTATVFSGFSKVWTLADNNLEVHINDQTALLSVTDKRSNKTWEQAALKEQFKIDKTIQKDNSLTVSFSGKYKLDVVFMLNSNSTLEISISADEKISIEELEFPTAFKTPDKNHYLLETDG